jgi:tetratricopeptide (TPR) repeat protein
MRKKINIIGFCMTLLFLLFCSLCSLCQVTEEELQSETAIILAFQQAEKNFESIYQSSSILEFKKIIDTLKKRIEEAELSDRLHEILLKSYEYSARAYFNSGQYEKASEYFSEIIKLDQKYSLDEKLVSPKIIELFDNVKKDYIGYIVVKSEPSGANVTIDGKVIGVTNLFQTPYLIGAYQLEVELPGYKKETQMVNIMPQQTLEVSIPLIRNTAAAFFVTQPPGVKIIIDGEARGTTMGPPDPSYKEKAEELGLDFNQLSAQLKVENIPLGTHQVEFRKECYEPILKTVRFDNPEDYAIAPAVLESSLATLTINSTPSGADIYLGDKLYGKTPAELKDLCSGKYRVVLKHLHGKFFKDIELKKDQHLTLDCTLRPTLVFLGVIPESEVEKTLVSEIETQVKELLAKVNSFNFISDSVTKANSLLSSRGLNVLHLTAKTDTGKEEISDAKMTEAINFLAEQLEAELIITAYMPDKTQARTLLLSVICPENPAIESFRVNLLSQLDTADFISKLNTSYELYKSWLGVNTVDTLLYDGIPILNISADSPAAQAEIKPGDIIKSIDGIKIEKTLDLLNFLKNKKAKETITLEYQTQDKQETKEIALGASPIEIPLNSPEVSYGKLMAELQHIAESSSDQNLKLLANYNLGLIYMHFYRWAEAIEQFKKATLTSQNGIGRGTLLYRMAQCYQNLGFRDEAIATYRETTSYKNNTIQDNNGPLVAPLAESNIAKLER